MRDILNLLLPELTARELGYVAEKFMENHNVNPIMAIRELARIAMNYEELQNPSIGGIPLRAIAAIYLQVPNSGIPVIDEMIKESLVV